MRNVKIIVQSEIFKHVEIVSEAESFSRVLELRKQYENLVAANKLRDEKFIDNGCLVTTSIIKEG